MVVNRLHFRHLMVSLSSQRFLFLLLVWKPLPSQCLAKTHQTWKRKTGRDLLFHFLLWELHGSSCDWFVEETPHQQGSLLSGLVFSDWGSDRSVQGNLRSDFFLFTRIPEKTTRYQLPNPLGSLQQCHDNAINQSGLIY